MGEEWGKGLGGRIGLLGWRGILMRVDRIGVVG